MCANLVRHSTRPHVCRAAAQKCVYLLNGCPRTLSIRCPSRPTKCGTLLQLSPLVLHFTTAATRKPSAAFYSLRTTRHQSEFTIPAVARFLCACVSNRRRYGEQVGLLRSQASLVIHRISWSGSPILQGSSFKEGCVRRMYSTRASPLFAPPGQQLRRPRPPR